MPVKNDNFPARFARQFFQPLAQFQFLRGKQFVAEATNLPERRRLTKNERPGKQLEKPAGAVPHPGDDFGGQMIFIQPDSRATARQRPEIICSATSASNSALGCESASTKMSQLPVAAATPALRAREIWFTGSNTTVAPAARAISAVRSVELLSQTINSVSQPIFANAAAADLILASDSPSSRSSLNAGMTIEIFTGRNVLHPPAGFNARIIGGNWWARRLTSRLAGEPALCKFPKSVSC